ncbi:two-component system activity regulator YycH [Paenibacillus sp.]|jgi:regulatory protein YycH of two-component signal transduction system YycFG|uniref:YycH family regulatory protein n=1 Tax=Paenibacillus sp. TaxID=58172 RepID=UPI0028246686|nr:two-component system activity regulator YycH [Paenibacillus sp.]MDR0267848.1 two-component system activity regulator YycH [Paenibacillus sp.]
MKERMKSILLLLLVIGSLVQSYYLIYRLPGSDTAAKAMNNYIKTDNMGPQEKVENLIYPDKMLIHMGGGKHTVFYPNSTFYSLINTRLKGRGFEGFQRRSVENMDWNKIRNEDPGIELTFGSGIPVSLLQRVMQIQPDPLFEAERINRIWIYNPPSDSKAHALFFSTEGDVVYEAGKVDLTVQDVQQHVDFGKSWIPYSMQGGGAYYLPEKPIDMIEASVEIGSYTVGQMQQSLFFDPGITRYIQEKDGSEIYTDSKRSLQVRKEQKWMSYTDPAAPPAGESSDNKDVLAAVDFVNEHGGWNGVYRLDLSGIGTEQSQIMFQQYYGSYPVLDTMNFHYGTMKLELQQSNVSTYERSLIYMQAEQQTKRMIKLPGGEELNAMLIAFNKESPVVDLYPAYLPELTTNGLKLTPVWAVKLANGQIRAAQL